MVLGRVITACAALAILTAASGARGGEAFVLGRGEDESRSSADEPAIASARAGADSTADFHSCPGDGLAMSAIRGASLSAPGSRTGALFRSILVPGYGQVYNGQRLKGGLLFTTEVALLSAALALHLAGDSYLNIYNREARPAFGSDPTGQIQQHYDAAQARYRIRDGLLLAATGLWVVNMADAYLSGGRAHAVATADAGQWCSREVAPLAAIRPGHAIFGLQGRF